MCERSENTGKYFAYNPWKGFYDENVSARPVRDRSVHLFSCWRKVSPGFPASDSGSGSSDKGTGISSIDSLDRKVQRVENTQAHIRGKSVLLLKRYISLKP